ncbi:MAG: shikimate dehydrogenase [Paramuribaculum sp.]|nr:shikimate dehydrogenase [Paramuribaculum sp.]
MHDNRKIYGLIGFPLGHSFSKDFFARKFRDENINAEYRNFPLENISQFCSLIAGEENLRGLNVTIPYKSAVIPYLHSIDPIAEKIGAVNVIKFHNDNGIIKLNGFNSDVIGFTNSIKPLLKPDHDKALVLGAGGASKAVVFGLKSMGIVPTIVSRSKTTSDYLTYHELDKEIIKNHKIIVNTTPLGMFPKIDESPDIPYRFLTENHLCYDLIYNPEETLFMKKAQSFGAQTKNGLEMLILQALAAWDIWTNKTG